MNTTLTQGFKKLIFNNTKQVKEIMRIITPHDFTETVDIVYNTIQDLKNAYYKPFRKYYDAKSFVQYFRNQEDNNFFSALLANKSLADQLLSGALIEPPVAEVKLHNPEYGGKTIVCVYIANMDLIKMLSIAPQTNNPALIELVKKDKYELEMLIETSSNALFDDVNARIKTRLGF